MQTGVEAFAKGWCKDSAFALSEGGWDCGEVKDFRLLELQLSLAFVLLNLKAQNWMMPDTFYCTIYS